MKLALTFATMSVLFLACKAETETKTTTVQPAAIEENCGSMTENGSEITICLSSEEVQEESFSNNPAFDMWQELIAQRRQGRSRPARPERPDPSSVVNSDSSSSSSSSASGSSSEQITYNNGVLECTVDNQALSEQECEDLVCDKDSPAFDFLQSRLGC